MRNETFTAVDLFSGIGAWAIACHATGIETLCFVEKDKNCQEFLSKSWPGIPIHGDVKSFDGRKYRGADIVFAGVPCQPASRAGKQRGAADDRWLWDEVLRVVSEIQPRVCVCENPPGIDDVGLDGILVALEGQGYEIGPIFDIPACAVDSPQLRHRYYISVFRVADSTSERQSEQGANRRRSGRENRTREEFINGSTKQSDLADVSRIGSGARKPERERLTQQQKTSGIDRDMARTDKDGRSERRATGSTMGHGHSAQSNAGNGDLADSKIIRERAGQRDSEPRKQRRDEPANNSAWSQYIWLPCSDGKVRRAPDNSIRMAHGLPVDLFETLATQTTAQSEAGYDHFQPTRTILGALGNAQIPQVAIEICKAIKAALVVIQPYGDTNTHDGGY